MLGNDVWADEFTRPFDGDLSDVYLAAGTSE